MKLPGKPLLFRRLASAFALLLFAQSIVLAQGITDDPSDVQHQKLIERWRMRDASRPEQFLDADTVARIDAPGDYRFSLRYDGLPRLYQVHVPASYSPERPAPLVLSLHGGGGNFRYQADDAYYGLIAKSEASGYIVVFPNGFSRFKSGKLASWNAGICCAGARDRRIDDVAFIRAMLDRLHLQLNIDPERIFANGMSNGGMMAYRLACEMSDTFRAVASVAGTDGTETCTPPRPVSILHIHARDDDTVLFDGGAGRKSRQLAEFPSVPASIAKWVRLNRCAEQPEPVLEVAGAQCTAYTQCRGDVEVRLCVTDRGGHSWPGGRKVRTGEPGSTAISATDVIWDFYQTH